MMLLMMVQVVTDLVGHEDDIDIREQSVKVCFVCYCCGRYDCVAVMLVVTVADSMFLINKSRDSYSPRLFILS